MPRLSCWREPDGGLGQPARRFVAADIDDFLANEKGRFDAW